jgi:TRAP-type C4-dicarboxylate transport system permease small subunit
MPSFVPARNRAAFDLSAILFIASLFCMFLAEAFMIRRLWFNHTPSDHPHRGFDLPFLVWIPAFFAFIFLQVLRRQTREGHINPALAESICTGLTFLVLAAYLLITRFALIAFR